jgi:hypothetical protein
MWGWAVEWPALRDFGTDFPAMPPAGALGCLLLACSYFAANRGRQRSERASYVAAGLAGLIAILSLLEQAGLATGMSFHFLPTVSHVPPAVMSPTASLAMLLLALTVPMPREFRILGLPSSSVIAGVVGSVAFFALLGWSLRMLRFDIAAPLLGFSLPGALCTLLAAFGVAAHRPGRWLVETLSGRGTGAVVTRWLLPAAFGVPLVSGWIRLLAEREGLFSEAFGMALFTLVMIVVFSALVLWVARTPRNWRASSGNGFMSRSEASATASSPPMRRDACASSTRRRSA